jgi:hypothetical protein
VTLLQLPHVPPQKTVKKQVPPTPVRKKRSGPATGLRSASKAKKKKLPASSGSDSGDEWPSQEPDPKVRKLLKKRRRVNALVEKQREKEAAEARQGRYRKRWSFTPGKLYETEEEIQARDNALSAEFRANDRMLLEQELKQAADLRTANSKKPRNAAAASSEADGTAAAEPKTPPKLDGKKAPQQKSVAQRKKERQQREEQKKKK